MKKKNLIYTPQNRESIDILILSCKYVFPNLEIEKKIQGDAHFSHFLDLFRRDGGHTGTTLYVRGLSLRTRDPDLEAKFAKFGKLVSCQIIRDPHTGESRRFGFVTFETLLDAEEGRKAMHDSELDGRVISVEQV